MRYLTLLFILINALTGLYGQSIQGLLMDQEGSPLPYATIYNISQQKGTATSEEGVFELRNVEIGDSLQCSFIGFLDQIIVIVDYGYLTITMQPSAVLIEEISITADDSFLYDWVAKVRKKSRTKTKKAKSYFFLESNIDGHTTEVLESYSNGGYQDHNANYLSIKKGRVGVDSINGRYFLSTGTSQAILKHELWNRKSPFPINPLAMSKRNLKRAYDLALISKYESDSDIITVVSFSPKDEVKDHFSGTIAFDSKYRLRKIELSIENTLKHPFLSFGGITIQSMDIRLSKTFKLIDGDPFVDNINFDYDISYLDRDSNPMSVKTKAYLNAYDYDSLFNLPIFKFSPHYHKDYRDMTVVPYDSIFWNNIDDFRLFEKKTFADQYIQKHKIDNGLKKGDKEITVRTLESPYLNWDTTMFVIEPLSEEQLDSVAGLHPYKEDRYFFNFKIYLDSYSFNDSTYYTSAAILDPVKTRYELPIDYNDFEWMNMYFDLLEIHRRKMMERVRSSWPPLTTEELKDEHIYARRDFISRSKLFKAQTKRGEDEDAIRKWKSSIERKLFALKRFSAKAQF